MLSVRSRVGGLRTSSPSHGYGSIAICGLKSRPEGACGVCASAASRIEQARAAEIVRNRVTDMNVLRNAPALDRRRAMLI